MSPRFWEEEVPFLRKDNTGGGAGWAGGDDDLVLVVLRCL